MNDRSLPVTRAVFPGILLLSAATLLLEIGWMRVLSVTLWYHFAFMVLSTALFGFGFAGVVLSLRRDAAVVTARFLGLAACTTPLAFVLGYSLFNQIPFEPFSLGRDPWQWLYLPLSYLAVTLPFFFSGLTIGSLVTRQAERVHHLYFFDLIGAGLGSLLVVLLLPLLGGAGTVFAAAGLAGLGATLIAVEAGPRWSAGAFGMALLFLGLAPFGDEVLPVRISSNKIVAQGVTVAKVLADPRYHRLTAWNTMSRIDVVEWRDQARHVHRSVLIDGGTAVNRLAHPQQAIDLLPPGRDDESFFLGLFSAPRVLVVGSGGGREVLLALRSRASQVTAVEINPAINKLVSEQMADFTGHIYQDPRVTVFTDEARSFLRRSEERYDLIHCPHTISNAAMASGSLSLAENYLLTLEAFGDFLEHLEEKGVLLFTRPEAHMPRLLSTARAALGVKGKEEIGTRAILWRQPAEGQSFYAGLALRQVPFSIDEIQGFADRLEGLGLEPLHLPGFVSQEPYESLVRGAALTAVPLFFPAILDPATDDKPFFNRRVPFSKFGWSDIKGVFSRGTAGRDALENRPVAEAALVMLLGESTLIALIFILVPLMVFRRRALEGEGRGSTLVAFSALGLAYITVEIGLIQRFTLYLGRPVVVYATVLGTLLISSGLGSALARHLKGQSAARRAALAAAGVALLTSVGLPSVIEATLAWSEGIRTIVAIFFLVGPGLLMGMPFPLLIHRMKQRYPERIPWAFGVNGFASVLGTVSAVLLSMTGGQTAVLLAGVFFYLVAAWAART